MVCIAVHGDGLVAFQYRKQDKANIEEVKIPLKHAEVIRLERVGRSFFVYVTKGGIPFWSVEVPDFDLPQELMVGLFICSHNPDVIEKAQFTNTHVYTKVSPK